MPMKIKRQKKLTKVLPKIRKRVHTAKKTLFEKEQMRHKMKAKQSKSHQLGSYEIKKKFC